jgi:PAS domain S-box-containing protein
VSDEKAGFLREALFNGNGVAKKLIVALVLFSSLITAVFTAAELYAEYRRDLGQIDRSIEFIGKGDLPALTDAVWVADREQVQTQLDGLLRLPDVEYIGIAVDGQTRWSAGKTVSQRIVSAEIPLVREHRGQALTIGTVRVVASVDRVIERLWHQLLVTLLSNAAKTLLVAGFMLLVFQYLVTRHLTRIAAFVRRIDPAAPRGEQVQLDRPASGRWRPDILDAVTTSINGLSSSLGAAVTELRSSEERLQLVLRGSTDAAWDLDLLTGQAYYSLRWLQMVGRQGSPPEALTASFWEQLTHPDDRQRVGSFYEEILRGSETTYELEFRLCHKDGHAVPVLSRGFVLRAPDGAAIRVSGTNTDLTERDKLQEAQRRQLAAEAANAAKSEFLSRMSHELRTPLNAVLGFSRVMLDESREPLSDRHRKQVSHIQAAGRHLHQLVSDLLDLSRIETGQLRISIEPVDLASIIDEVFEILGSVSRPADVELAPLPLGHELPRVMADATRLRQVLFNLLSNALKYNRVGGKVWVEAAAMGDRLVIGVCDSGVGMTEVQLAHLFEPYNRLGREGGQIEGVGIGLNVTRALVEMMGGAITVNSVPGRGSSFRVSLAIAQEADIGDAVDTGWAQGIDIAEPAGVVISIEDNPVNQLLLEALLARWPQVTLLQAVTGAAGLEMMRTHKPDLVLLDMNLPDMNGLKVMEHMSADPNLQSAKVIVLSADALSSDVELARERGAVNYLTKPIDPRPFFDSIAFHLGDRRAPEIPDK